MIEIAGSIDLKLPAKLRDRGYRQKFFLAEASARIAAQIIALRKRRGLSQKQVAEIAGTRQPAISRAEQADYQNWSFNTLRAIADALDARIRVVIEPAEDVMREYARNGNSQPGGENALRAFSVGYLPQETRENLPFPPQEQDVAHAGVQPAPTPPTNTSQATVKFAAVAAQRSEGPKSAWN